MKFKAIWTNYKIYAFILGIVAGTLVYNLIGVDFSFSMYRKIDVTNVWRSFAYLFISNLKFFLIILIVSFFDIKRKILPIIIFYQAFTLSGIITTMILSESRICIYAIPAVFIKLASSMFMFEESKPILNRVISCAIIIFGTIVENFFIIYF